jgi:hypothetical protein
VDVVGCEEGRGLSCVEVEGAGLLWRGAWWVGGELRTAWEARRVVCSALLLCVSCGVLLFCVSNDSRWKWVKGRDRLTIFPTSRPDFARISFITPPNLAG